MLRNKAKSLFLVVGLIFTLNSFQVNASCTNSFNNSTNSLTSFAKTSLKASASVACLGSLGYSTVQLVNAIKYWLKSDSASEVGKELSEKSRESLGKCLIGLLVAAGSGVIATNDITMLKLNLNVDIVQLIGLLLQSRR